MSRTITQKQRDTINKMSIKQLSMTVAEYSANIERLRASLHATMSMGPNRIAPSTKDFSDASRAYRTAATFEMCEMEMILQVAQERIKELTAAL